MDKQEIEHNLQLLGQELAHSGRTGAILIVGGAVMVCIVGNRYATRDIDASFEREAMAIRAAAAHVAAREGLPSDWLNDGASGFLYSQPPATLWRSYPGLDIYLPALDYILAMKVVAGRIQDLEDAKALVQHIGLSSPEAVLDILKRYIPARYLTAAVQYRVEELFA